MSARYIDKHDVRAFCARTREVIDAIEERAVKATGPGWLLERKEHAGHARAFVQRAHDTLDELMECLAYSIAADEKVQEAETAALLGDEDPKPAD